MRKRKTFLLLLALALTGCMRTDYHLVSDRAFFAMNDWYHLQESVCLPEAPLSLDDLIQIGLERSLELQIYCQEVAIQHEITTGEKLKMLPNLIFNIEYSSRNRNTGSSSESLTDRPPAPPSISSEQQRLTWDLNLEWNLLDFGISYYRARQEGNITLAKQFEYERVKQKLILNIVEQYWRAMMAHRAMLRAEEIIASIEKQQDKLTENVKLRVISEVTTIERQDNLLTIYRALMDFDRVYHQALSELKKLLAIPPQIEIVLLEESHELLEDPIYDVVELQKLALVNRPELYENDFNQKASIEAVHEAFIKMFPGTTLFWAADYDSNKFLVFNHWMSIGARATWDLLRLPAKRAELSVARKREMLTEINRLALSMGVITQVNLAYLMFKDDLDDYRILKQHEQVKRRRLEIAEKRYRAGVLGAEELVRFEGEALEVEAEALVRYANLQISLERLNNAIGLPRYFNSEVSQ